MEDVDSERLIEDEGRRLEESYRRPMGVCSEPDT